MTISRLVRLLFVAYFIDVGVILVVMPWSVAWTRNYFVEMLPMLRAVLENGFVRGMVTGIGIVNIVAGLADLRLLMPWHESKG